MRSKHANRAARRARRPRHIRHWQYPLPYAGLRVQVLTTIGGRQSSRMVSRACLPLVTAELGNSREFIIGLGGSSCGRWELPPASLLLGMRSGACLGQSWARVGVS